jgi:hypothetical protein
MIVGGLVDVLAITGINRVTGQRQQINDSWRAMLESADKYPDRAAYEQAVDAFILKNRSQIEYLDSDVFTALIKSRALPRLWRDPQGLKVRQVARFLDSLSQRLNASD